MSLNTILSHISSYVTLTAKNLASSIPDILPKKFVKIDGITKLNPDFKTYQHAHGQTSSTALDPDQALAVVSNPEQHEELRQASLKTGQGDVPLSEDTDAALKAIQNPEIGKQVGLSPDAMIEGLNSIFTKHEVPMGLMNKLMVLSEFDELEFMVDDSGSMANNSDTKDESGRLQTRWGEVHSRLKEMIEILAYIPTQKITICFLNRNDIVTFQRKGETPQIFTENAYRQLDAIFANGPSGGTPVRERLEESFVRGEGKRVSRYLFCDGCPNGGDADKEAISKMMKDRKSPESNPVAFLSCTSVDSDVEWMKEAEEIAPYCAELDDFHAEAEEVRRDQGNALPFTKGFWLIAQLVAAMNPEDLDSMDESVPFTKWTLDSMLGYQSSEQEYRHYFEGFKEAQRKRKIESTIDTIKANFNWDSHFSEFLVQRSARGLAAVQQFNQKLAEQATSKDAAASIKINGGLKNVTVASIHDDQLSPTIKKIDELSKSISRIEQSFMDSAHNSLAFRAFSVLTEGIGHFFKFLYDIIFHCYGIAFPAAPSSENEGQPRPGV